MLSQVGLLLRDRFLASTARALDTSTAFTAYPLFDGAKWDDVL